MQLFALAQCVIAVKGFDTFTVVNHSSLALVCSLLFNLARLSLCILEVPILLRHSLVAMGRKQEF
jgi:hypothetical protein